MVNIVYILGEKEIVYLKNVWVEEVIWQEIYVHSNLIISIL